MIEAVPSLDRRQVDEVARLGPSKHGEHLVDRELLEPGVLQSAIDSRDQSVDRIRAQPEEGEGLPLNVAAGDKRGFAGEREAVCLAEARDDKRKPTLLVVAADAAAMSRTYENAKKSGLIVPRRAALSGNSKGPLTLPSSASVTVSG